MNSRMHRKRWFTRAVFLAAGLLALSVAGGSAAIAANLFGMNFNFHWVDASAIAKCGPRDRTAPARGHAFLSRYEDPQVRDRVRGELAQMRNSGFQAIRSLIWFGRPGEARQDSFSVNAPQIAARNVSLFADDVQAAGFGRLYLGFGPVGVMTPVCRRAQWGDCFDAGTIPQSIDFITQVRSALSPAAAAIAYFDLKNEGGLSRFHNETLHQNMNAYLNALLPAYFRRFPQDRTTVSVQERNVGERVGFVERAYRQAGRPPAFLDVHIYHPTPEILGPVAAVLQSLGQRMPAIVGEFPYGDAAALSAIEASLAPVRGGDLPVLFWPRRDSNSACGVDTPPPYNLSWVGRR